MLDGTLADAGPRRDGGLGRTGGSGCAGGRRVDRAAGGRAAGGLAAAGAAAARLSGGPFSVRLAAAAASAGAKRQRLLLVGCCGRIDGGRSATAAGSWMMMVMMRRRHRGELARNRAMVAAQGVRRVAGGAGHAQHGAVDAQLIGGVVVAQRTHAQANAESVLVEQRRRQNCPAAAEHQMLVLVLLLLLATDVATYRRVPSVADVRTYVADAAVARGHGGLVVRFVAATHRGCGGGGR